jgi:hypothetical protein
MPNDSTATSAIALAPIETPPSERDPRPVSPAPTEKQSQWLLRATLRPFSNVTRATKYVPGTGRLSQLVATGVQTCGMTAGVPRQVRSTSTRERTQ